jgi:hypothetical protein
MSNRQISQTTKDLIAAKAKIDSPEKWCQGSSYKPHTHQYCSMGAVASLYRNVILGPFISFERASLGDIRRYGNAACILRKVVCKRNVKYNPVSFNDNSTHEEVMKWWDEAIAYSMQKDNKE